MIFIFPTGATLLTPQLYGKNQFLPIPDYFVGDYLIFVKKVKKLVDTPSKRFTIHITVM